MTQLSVNNFKRYLKQFTSFLKQKKILLCEVGMLNYKRIKIQFPIQQQKTKISQWVGKM